jgi:3'-phosphoadenosine 5'-phosphosulfate sulfotransferase (PAPS reductase)/FAD synthetase
MIGDKESEAVRAFVKDYAVRSLVSCFSGGKDSLAATHLVLNALAGNHAVDKYVVYVDTGAMLPTTTPYVQKVSEEQGWPLTVLQGDFFGKAEKWGMPTMRRRWCCVEVKLKLIWEFVKKLPPQRAEVTGLRRNESARRKRKLKNAPVIYLNKRIHSWHFAPLMEWSGRDVARYLAVHKLPIPPHYRTGLRETCMCGAFSTRKQLMILKAQHPELFQKFIELERNFRMGGSCFYLQGKKVRASDLAKQRTIDG